jgi:membrane dipeptidase
MNVPPADVSRLGLRAGGGHARPLADGHADSLLWNRDLTVRQRRGRLDFPRLEEAGVRLQCFVVVTHGYPIVGGVGAVAWWRGWPRAARRGPWARCGFQIDRLHELCARSDGKVRVAGTAAELERTLASGAIAAVLGVEGAHALEGRLERVRELRARGVAFMGPVHLRNNELGGSSTLLMGDRPLTPFGCAALEAMEASGMAVDLAHASHRTFRDVLRATRGPLLCSHAGTAAVTPGRRNLDDSELRAIADRGGVTGIIFATIYLGGRTIDHLVRHVLHALQAAGEDAVAFGSDHDGMVRLPRGMRDVTDLPGVVDALSRRLPARVVEKVAWANWRRFFGEALGTGSGTGR